MIFNEWIGRGISCWSKISCGSPTICKNFHPDFVASPYSSFFEGHWTDHSKRLSSGQNSASFT